MKQQARHLLYASLSLLMMAWVAFGFVYHPYALLVSFVIISSAIFSWGFGLAIFITLEKFKKGLKND